MTAKQQDLVQVYVRVTEQVTYVKTIAMPRADFERLDRMLDPDSEHEDERGATEEIRDMLDPFTDLYSTDDAEVETFELHGESS